MSTKRRGRPAALDPEELLDSAEALFSEKGYAATSTREIASKAGCNVALISYYFDGKEGIYHAVIKRHVQRVSPSTEPEIQALSREFDGISDPQIRRFCGMIFSAGLALLNNRRMHRIMVRELMNGGKTALNVMKNSEKTAFVILHQELKKLQEAGKFRKDLNIPMVLASMIGTMLYSCIAEPIIHEIYGLGKVDRNFTKSLVLHFVQTLFPESISKSLPRATERV